VKKRKVESAAPFVFLANIRQYTFMDSLPSEIIERILFNAATLPGVHSLRKVPATTPHSLGQVCYRWRQIVYRPTFQQPWSFIPVILQHDWTCVEEQELFISEWVGRCHPEDLLDICVTTPVDRQVHPANDAADTNPIAFPRSYAFGPRAIDGRVCIFSLPQRCIVMIASTRC